MGGAVHPPAPGDGESDGRVGGGRGQVRQGGDQVEDEADEEEPSQVLPIPA